MRIIILSDSPQILTGYGVASYNLGKYFKRKGHHIAYVGFQHLGSPLYVKVDDEYLPIYEGSTTLSVERAFKEWKPDVGIHIRDAFAHSPRHFQYAYSFANLKHKPPLLLNSPVQNDMLPQEFIDACNREAELVVSPTEWGRDVLLFQGVPYNRLEYIPWGYDPEVYYPKSVKKSEYGFDDGRPLIMGMGINDQHRKGWSILLKAISILKKSMDCDLFLMTTPEGHFQLYHLAAQLGMKGQVAYVGNYSKTWGKPGETVNELFNMSDCFCSASIEEGFSIPPLEYAATGNPVVETDMPVLREVLGEHGFYVPSVKNYPGNWSWGWIADAEKMAETLKKLLETNDGARRKMREAQLEYVKKLSWEKIVERWEEVFRNHKELKLPV